ncbi:MAG: hypothetical protein JWR05_188 [Mucilaginibacter sp.]|nr:hypothetical protein [Mucilaginibacter sp.]
MQIKVHQQNKSSIQNDPGHQVRSVNAVFKKRNSKQLSYDNVVGSLTETVSPSYNFNQLNVNTPITIQPRLTINQPNDIYEQQADAVAEKVMRMPDAGVKQISPFLAGNKPIDVQRKCAECEEEEKQKLQRKESGISVPVVSSAVSETLQSAGQSLDITTRSFMEPRFGFDFGKVRIHNDSQAQQSAKDINALAYTHQNNIVFGAGQYQPQTDPGRKLLAHELTHVIQQSSMPNRAGEFHIGEQNKLFEQQADNNSGQLLTEDTQSLDKTMPKQYTGSPFLQRQVPGVPSLFSPIPKINLPSDEIMIDEAEGTTAENPKLASLAIAYKEKAVNNPQEYIKLSTYLSESFQLDSAKAAGETTRLQRRMADIKNALVKLGVPANSVEISPATAFSTHGEGQITASLYNSPQSNSYLLPQKPLLGPAAPATAGGASPSLSDLLSFKFKAGPLQFAVELPKSVAIKLPVALNIAQILSFELKAESSGDFSFTISLNGSRHLNVAAKAAVKFDKDKGSSGSAGLEITTTKTVCNAPSPDSLKAKITESGEKLAKALKELETVKPDERLSKLIDIAGTIGEIYDAVDKSKSQCKEVPRATVNIGVQVPINPSDSTLNDPDPTKRPASSIGVTLTVPF